MIDQIWQGRAISEAALSTCISGARRAIGDTGEEQRLIRTTPKRGFCFIGQVEDGLPVETTPGDPGKSGQQSSAPTGQLQGHYDSSALVLPDKPSIAVLPFQNMSGDPEQEYFADGLTEDIITGLSRQRWFFVIARNSSFRLQGRSGRRAPGRKPARREICP